MQKFQVGSHSLLREIEKHILQSLDLFTSEEITHSLFSLNGSLSSYFLFNKWNGKENHPPGFFLALEFSQHFLNSQKTSPEFSAEQLGYIVLSLGDLYLKCNLSAHPGGQTVQSAMSSAAIKLLESDGILQLDLSRCIRGLSRGSASNAAIVSALCGATSKLLQPESKGGVGARSLEMFLHSVADISTAKGLKSIEERYVCRLIVCVVCVLSPSLFFSSQHLNYFLVLSPLSHSLGTGCFRWLRLICMVRPILGLRPRRCRYCAFSPLWSSLCQSCTKK
jgi:hypothetical protein